jgi:hypothetical protein
VPNAAHAVARGGCACHVGARRSAGTGNLYAGLLLAAFMARRRGLRRRCTSARNLPAPTVVP